MVSIFFVEQIGEPVIRFCLDTKAFLVLFSLVFLVCLFGIPYVAICLATLVDRRGNRRRVFAVPSTVVGRIIRRRRPVAIVVACFNFMLLCNIAQ